MKKRIMMIFTVVSMLVLMSACGNGFGAGGNTSDHEGIVSDDTNTNVHAGTDESYFEWDGNLIVALTEEGSKQKSILIPARCEGFSGVIFQDTDVEHVAFEDDDDITLNFAFMGAENIVSVELPANLTTIDNSCFQNCKGLQSISIPASVSSVKEYAFSGCYALEEVVFEGNALKQISDNCFEFCSSLKSIVIPEGIESIGKYAFSECTSLETVTLSETVSSIAKFAFGNTAITELHLPEGMEISSMDTSAFGTNAYYMTVYITPGSWCDENRDSWNIDFGEIKYEQ